MKNLMGSGSKQMGVILFWACLDWDNWFTCPSKVLSNLVYDYRKGYLCGLTAGSLKYLFLLKITKAN